MAEESFQEKTEQATTKRREDARQKGQVARSTAAQEDETCMLEEVGGWVRGGGV